MDFSIPAGELSRHGNIFSCMAEGLKVWVKKRRRRENILYWHMQRALHALTRTPLLLPPAPPPTDNVEFETGRLRQAAALGLRIPAVLHRAPEYFVIEDAGISLDYYVKRVPIGRDERDALVGKAARELRRMHGLGLAHGGAQIRNIVVRDGEIGFIDLEENIPADKLELFKLRDIFLFLFSLEKARADPDLRRIATAYGRDGAEAEETLRRLVTAIRQLRIVRILDFFPFSGLRLRDVRPISALVRKADREYKGNHDC